MEILWFILGIIFYMFVFPLLENVAETISYWLQAVSSKWALEASEVNLKITKMQAEMNELSEDKGAASAIGFEYVGDDYCDCGCEDRKRGRKRG